MFQPLGKSLPKNLSGTDANVSRGRKGPKRKFGDIPAWAQVGPISLKNYDLRAEWDGAKVKQWGDSWPFLSHDPDTRATADEEAWMSYFWDHLGGLPLSAEIFRTDVIRFLNVPEERPEIFDPSYVPRMRTGT